MCWWVAEQHFLWHSHGWKFNSHCAFAIMAPKLKKQKPFEVCEVSPYMIYVIYLISFSRLLIHRQDLWLVRQCEDQSTVDFQLSLHKWLWNDEGLFKTCLMRLVYIYSGCKGESLTRPGAQHFWNGMNKNWTDFFFFFFFVVPTLL